MKTWRKVSATPYASIPANLIASAAYRTLSGAAVRVHWLLEAAWVPDKGAVVPVNWAAEHLSISTTTVGAALKELASAGIARKVRAGIRPCGNAAAGTSAVYDLPHRNRAGSLPPDSLPAPEGWQPWRRQPGDPKLQGSWRVYARALRALAASVTNNEAKVLSDFHASDRKRHGGPQINPPHAVSYKRLGMARQSVSDALAGLVDQKLIQTVESGAGRRATTYCLHGTQTAGVKRGRRRDHE